MTENYILRIYRGNPGKQYWEEFELELTPYANVISSLMAIQRDPVNSQGERVAPVVWESGCLEEVCGSCSMLVNGMPRQACTALIAEMIKNSGQRTILLAPLTKFPLVRDLIVDRSQMFENLKKVKAWINVDKTYEVGQINQHSKFIGPAAISQVRLLNANPVGHTQKAMRLHSLMEEGGIADCGNAQNCVRVCPKNIPLTDSIAAIGREVNLQVLEDLFSFPDREP